MPYKYPVAPGYQPPHLTIPAVPVIPSSGSYWVDAGPTQVSLAPSSGTATRTIYEQGQVRQIPIIRVLPATPTDNEAQALAPVKYSPEYLYPNRLPRQANGPVSRNAMSQTGHNIAYGSLPPVRRPIRSDSAEQISISSPPLRLNTLASSPPSLQTAQLVAPSRSADHTATRSASPPKERAPYQAIDDIVCELQCCILSFQRPRDLDFVPTPLNPVSVPISACTPKNALLLEQIHKLEGLRKRLKRVHSHGNRGVRKARREARAQVDRALEELRWVQNMTWNKVSEFPEHIALRMNSDYMSF